MDINVNKYGVMHIEQRNLKFQLQMNDGWVNTLNDIRSMRRTLEKLIAWANRQDMDFSVNKYGLMHIGKRNVKFQYQMNDRWVKSIDGERDLGVLMSKDLKFSK